MIPHTYPTSVVSGKNAMQVGLLSSITGLRAWIDYIPVKLVTQSTTVENTFSITGYRLSNAIEITNKQAWLDYIPIYDVSANVAFTKPWSTDIGGYIPIYGDNVSPILSLFAAGEQGAWYDPSDFSTMFQDAAGSTPVTAVGQAVGRILDKSGRGNHATQTTSTKRPVLQQDANGKYFLLFDGIDDALQTASVNFTGTGKVTVWAGVRKLSDATRGILVELSALGTDLRKFVIDAPLDTTKKYRIVMAGDAVTNPEYAYTGAQYVAPHTSVLTGVLNRQLTTNSAILRINGQLNGTFSSPFTYIDTFGNYPLFIGSRGGTSLPFNGRLYSLIIRGAQSTATQISNAETYVNSKTGAY